MSPVYQDFVGNQIKVEHGEGDRVNNKRLLWLFLGDLVIYGDIANHKTW